MSIGEILAAIPAQSQNLRESGYKFRQGKALNDAWASSLVRSKDGAMRPDENRYMDAIAKARLGPEAGMAYWQYQTGQFENAQRQSEAANAIAFNGGDFRTIKGPAPEPTVTEAPAPTGFDAPAQSSGLSNFLRPKPKGPHDLSSGTNVDEMAPAPTDGEVIVRGHGSETRAPEVGALPAVDLERTYTPPAPEGVATQFARSINPTMPSMMDQWMDTGMGGQGAEVAPPALSFETMNPTERQYAERFLARSGIPGAPEDQLRAFEKVAMQGVAEPVPFNPMRARVRGANGSLMVDPSKLADEKNRATADAARYQSERAKAITDARKTLFGAYGDVQGASIARAGSEANLQEKARPREAINQQVAALNQKLGTSFDPSKMGDEKTAAEVLERVRLQKELLHKIDGVDVIRSDDGSINGRATAFQIVPLMESIQKLEGLNATEGTLQMLMSLMAPSTDIGTLVAINPKGYATITGAGANAILSKMNSMPIDEFRAMVKHSINASPGMAVIYKNFQSDNPRPLPVVGLDGSPASKPVRTAGEQLGDFLRPKRTEGPAKPAKPPKAPAKAATVTPAQFDRAWANAKPGDRVVGPDGKPYTKGGR